MHVLFPHSAIWRSPARAGPSTSTLSSTGNRALSNDDTDEDSQPRNVDGTFEVDYERGRILIYNQKYGGILFGIFEVDETGDRALLKIQFHEYHYPEEFTEDALVYTERTNLGRRRDAFELGVIESPY
ncbi:hypothetical protein ES703_71634 [subsurface metagenome]